MRRRYRSESGQAVVLMALALVGLVAFAALAIDAGRMYSEKRHAQNAADNAALAAARAMCLDQDFTSAALLLAGENGYENDGVDNIVTVFNPPTAGPHSGDWNYVEVVIVSNFPGTLIQFFREGGLQVTVRAVSKCLPGVGEGFAAVFAISQTCNNTILWSGSSGLVDGGLHSNNDVQIMGDDNTITGAASYVTTFDEINLTFIPPPEDNPILGDVLDDPLKLNLEDYVPGSPKAEAAGPAYYHYRDGNITMNWLKANGFYDKATDIIRDGLYYATGNITINGNGLRSSNLCLDGWPTITTIPPSSIPSHGDDDTIGIHFADTTIVLISNIVVAKSIYSYFPGPVKLGFSGRAVVATVTPRTISRHGSDDISVILAYCPISFMKD